MTPAIDLFSIAPWTPPPAAGDVPASPLLSLDAALAETAASPPELGEQEQAAWRPVVRSQSPDRLAELETAIKRSPGDPFDELADDLQQGPGAEFYGVRASGSKFVFVVDSSTSMRGARWTAAVEELFAALERLQEGQFFYVVFFDAVARPMFGQPASEASLAAVEKANIDRLRRWIPSISLGPETEPLEAIKIACRLKPDAIFLLSDGEFRGKTALYLRRNNRRGRTSRSKTPAAAVHTIAVGSRAGYALLERIASENGGRFRWVD